MDRLREASGPRVDAQPALAAEPRVLGDDDQRRPGGAVGQRQRRADGAGEERQDAAGARQLGRDHVAAVDERLVGGETLGEATADGFGQLSPGRFADERAEAQIADRRRKRRSNYRRWLAGRLVDLKG